MKTTLFIWPLYAALTQALFDEGIQAKSRPIDGHFPFVQRRDGLKELSDSSSMHRFRAARHPNTPVESIVILAVGDHWEHVRCAAVLHPKCPEQILRARSMANGENGSQSRFEAEKELLVPALWEEVHSCQRL